MIDNLPQTLKLRAHLVSSDRGKTWVVARQFFLVNMKTKEYVEHTDLEGTRLAVIEEEDQHGDASKSLD